jgi:hypothetical protein
MDGFSVWKIHRAVSLHLTSMKYDLFEYNGRVKNSSIDVFMKQNTRKLYDGIARHLEKPFDAVQFVLGNMIYTSEDMTLNSASSWDNYKMYMRHRESLTKFISDDLVDIDLRTDLVADGPPKLLRSVVSGKCLPQTVVAINRKYNNIDDWLAKDYFGIQKYVIKLKKLDKFVKYNQQKIDSIIEEKENATV